MELKEYNELKLYRSEDELCTILELISDKINFNGYEEQELILLVKEILDIDILSLSYTVREQLLSTLCDAVSYYDIRNKVDWGRVLSIRNDIEDDLKEYIEEFFM